MKFGILSTCEGYDWAGSEENWAWFAQAAMAAGHQVMFGGDRKLVRGARVQELKAQGMLVTERQRINPMKLYLLKEKFRPDMRAMIDFKPDALFLNAGSPLDYCQLPYLSQFISRFNVPKLLLLTFNSDILPFPRRSSVEKFFSTLGGVVCVSAQNRDLLLQQLAGKIPETRIVRNVSRLSLPAPLPYPSLDAGIRLACVARFDTHWKGHDILLAALASSALKPKPWTLRFYGKGPDEEYVRSLVEYYGLRNRVEFCGYVPRVEDQWRDNHLLVLASRGEGLPLTAVEAMMCGRPCVLTPVGGNTEVVSPGRTGFIAEAATEPCFTRALDLAFALKGRWAAMGQEAHASALKFNQVQPGPETLSFMEDLVHARGGA
jgi:glycosyltransferase involved in cell wall biosynthesis